MNALEILVLGYLGKALGDPEQAAEKLADLLRSGAESLKEWILEKAADSSTEIDDAAAEVACQWIDQVVDAAVGTGQ